MVFGLFAGNLSKLSRHKKKGQDPVGPRPNSYLPALSNFHVNRYRVIWVTHYLSLGIRHVLDYSYLIKDNERVRAVNTRRGA